MLDADDLAALLATPDVLGKLHGQGITDLLLDHQLDATDSATLDSALNDSGLHWSSDALTSVEVALLGLSTYGTDLTDPSHNPFGLKY